MIRGAAVAKSRKAKAGGTRTARAAKRERLAPQGDTRYVRRSDGGQFKESDDAGRAQTRDRATTAKRVAASGQGDRGDRTRTGKAGSRSPT
jgi:hypothetical protein